MASLHDDIFTGLSFVTTGAVIAQRTAQVGAVVKHRAFMASLTVGDRMHSRFRCSLESSRKVYRRTWLVRYLDTARHMADYFLNSMHTDGIIPWDFNAPRVPARPDDLHAGDYYNIKTGNDLVELGVTVYHSPMIQTMPKKVIIQNVLNAYYAQIRTKQAHGPCCARWRLGLGPSHCYAHRNDIGTASHKHRSPEPRNEERRETIQYTQHMSDWRSAQMNG